MSFGFFLQGCVVTFFRCNKQIQIIYVKVFSDYITINYQKIGLPFTKLFNKMRLAFLLCRSLYHVLLLVVNASVTNYVCGWCCVDYMFVGYKHGAEGRPCHQRTDSIHWSHVSCRGQTISQLTLLH